MKIVRKRVVVLISGRGSNMQALIAAAKAPDFPAEIVGVISDRANAGGLALAHAEGIKALAVKSSDFASGEDHEAAIERAIGEIGADLICLAGYMKLLSAEFVHRWTGRMINIHPSLLPLFKGLDTHRRVLQSGMRVHGCTVHFVSPEMDGGPIIAQAAVPVANHDNEDSLAARVLKAEHRLYPLALRLLAEGKIKLDGERVANSLIGQVDDDQMILSPDPSKEPVDVEALARFTP